MLSQRWNAEKLGEILVSRSQWKPFPRAGERQAWEQLPEALRQAYIGRGEAALEQSWPALPATLLLDYARTGNRGRCEGVRNRRRKMLADLALAECVEGKGRFVEGIADGVWTTCEETYWGVPAHLNAQRAGAGLPDVAEPTVDLFAGETVALLAWIWYLVRESLDEVSPLLGKRILCEADRRVLTPCLEREDFWWMGFAGRRVNNWNPWCNSNWLTAALILEQDEGRRLAAVAKILRSLDRFIDPYPADGGCDEGPGYWGRAGASLFDCLELLSSATGGAVEVYDQPLIQEIGRYLYRVQIADRYFVNFADAAAMVSPAAGVVFLYGKRIGDARMMALGAWAAQQQQLASKGMGDSIGRQLPALLALDEMGAVEPVQPLPRDVWFDAIEVMAARDREGAVEGLYVAAKGGHNAESHNHNDVGHFIVYADGRPVIVDAGVEAYTAKTFSADRYQIWTMQSAYHSLPTIGGVMQAPGQEFAARQVGYAVDDQQACLRLDLAGAYPPEAGVDSWMRTVTLQRGKAVEVVDQFALSREASGIFLSLLTPCVVGMEGVGKIRLQERCMRDERFSGNAWLEYPADRLTASVEEIEVEDDRLRSIWGGKLFRIVLKMKKPPRQGGWRLRIVR